MRRHTITTQFKLCKNAPRGDRLKRGSFRHIPQRFAKLVSRLPSTKKGYFSECPSPTRPTTTAKKIMVTTLTTSFNTPLWSGVCQSWMNEWMSEWIEWMDEKKTPHLPVTARIINTGQCRVNTDGSRILLVGRLVLVRLGVVLWTTARDSTMRYWNFQLICHINTHLLVFN
jgi:hypothetical protein